MRIVSRLVVICCAEYIGHTTSSLCTERWYLERNHHRHHHHTHKSYVTSWTCLPIVHDSVNDQTDTLICLCVTRKHTTKVMGIWILGLVFHIAVRGAPPFQPFAMLGGCLWATGNAMCPFIISQIGIGLGLLLCEQTLVLTTLRWRPKHGCSSLSVCLPGACRAPPVFVESW